MIQRLEPMDAAKQFVMRHFPLCSGAVLAGSVVRGEATETSDLDIVVFDENLPTSYRESVIELGWCIEVFAHNFTSYQAFFEQDCKRARPSLPRMVAEGFVLVDHGKVEDIKREAQRLLDQGPEAWTDETIQLKRYFLTDALDDLIGCTNKAEELFVANTLANLTHEFILRTNRHWVGDSKWIVRELCRYDEEFAERFIDAFHTFYKLGYKERIVQIVDEVLAPFGGRLFEGFSLGKEQGA
ncbi:nucleotidyltransferase domain-containing protein [Priestia koreensis]|uniref:nucleotidyltransferase domain-containing protein n=1 Tax=Priestia koreensis TaxID=284581 RepID=UPI001F56C136|nr:nucleotidyltransferase domain-containing protein [Priestia koreensis]UNL83247.1 nucleotidyltransferase domain-containing protein [Priestia koreensis]